MPPSMIDPSKFGGYSRETGLPTGLAGKEFVSHCPPGVQKNARIIAVCGIPYNYASPQEDGWFISDFYLWFHLLQDLSRCSGVFTLENIFIVGISLTSLSEDQKWLTCAKPQDLVNSYQQYVHGHPRGDRRVVLDSKLLPRVNAAEKCGKLDVIAAQDLLHRFVSIIESEVEIAAQREQPVFVLVFGHGDDSDNGHGICIGGKGGQAPSVPRLTISAFEEILNKYPSVQVSMMMTSCYSGGWVIQPCREPRSRRFGKPRLNLSAMNAVDDKDESVAWAASKSCGRYAGGQFSTAVLNALLLAESDTPKDVSMFEALNSQVTHDDDGEPIRLSPTYAQLTKSIQNAVDELFPNLQDHNKVTFSAQDDMWDSEWRQRSGFPLARYQELWNELEEIPRGSPLQGASRTGGKLSKPGQNILRAKACEFMMSNPGDEALGGNAIHKRFRRFINGAELDEDEWIEYSDALDYRLNEIKLADEYLELLGIESVGCARFSVEEWLAGVQAEATNPTSAAPRFKRDYERFTKVHALVRNSKLFSSVEPYQGAPYQKPRYFLAIAIAQSELSPDEIEKGLSRCMRLKSARLVCLADTPVGKTIQKDEGVQRSRRRFYDTLSRFKFRMRSRSPRKNSPQKAREV